MTDTPKGIKLLQDPRLNKSTAFTEAERDALGLRGLLPPRVTTIEQQLLRVMANFAGKTSNLEKYVFLTALQDRNETLFYRALLDHVEEMLPIVYTPTVGEATLKFGQVFRRPRGLYVSADDRGRVAAVLRNWPEHDLRVIVVTDGERILGLGDLGAYGMGIPIGKLSLYTALAGVHPAWCLPVMLDVGTDTAALRDDPLYTGLLRPRLRGPEYEELVDEFVLAVQEAFPSALIQFEDFATDNAIGLLERYRDRVLCFNDDIQGTAAVTLAGLLAAGRAAGRAIAEERILFFGAGSAATGIAHLIVGAMERDGLTGEEARGRIWFMDSRGLVEASRPDLARHKRPFAHTHPPVRSLEDAVEALRPTALIGVSGQGGAFTEPALRAMARHHDRPVVFALSNPTANSECTAEEAYRATGGRVVFASGSPFDPVALDGTTYVPGQGNNAYIFPGVGLGVIAAGARRVTDAMFHAAARALSDLVGDDRLRAGCVYPSLTRIRDVSTAIAVSVARTAYGDDLADGPEPADVEAHVRLTMWEPVYRSYV